ncbi:YdeI/OmpD-associated family protein [Flavobacterium daejeonense]|uniref:YdeI/OmpD-associated family protein n=1 Tax=Flavobacterium daejeonense TaxID=350893 RepID=UPI00047C1DC5|nr:YdeI/OmpD-associated family protein [Flavobacterium daejeonense]
MAVETSYTFQATIEIIGINPFVFVPEEILSYIFEKAAKSKGPIPVKGSVNAVPYTQNLMKFKGEWRLYINTKMLKNSPKRIGEQITISIDYDAEKRSIPIHPKLLQALKDDKAANNIFQNLRPSLQHEIIRYIAHLKTEESIDKNILKAIAFLLGKGKFVGREKP